MKTRDMIHRRENSMKQGRVNPDWMTEKQEEDANELKQAMKEESEKQDAEDLKNSLPNYEAEDSGCSCIGVESEWEWDARQGLYVCSGCGDVQ